MAVDINFDRYGVSMGKPIGILHRIANGYIMTLVPAAEGVCGKQVYCSTEQAVGDELLRFVAEENLR